MDEVNLDERMGRLEVMMQQLIDMVGKNNERITAIELRLDGMESRLDSVESRLDSMEEKQNSMNTRLEEIKSEQSEMSEIGRASCRERVWKWGSGDVRGGQAEEQT